jgi:hypothetical protein
LLVLLDDFGAVPCLPMMNRLLHFEGPPILTWWRSFSSAQRAVGRASRPLGRVDHLIASRIDSFDLLLLFDEGSWLAGTAPPWAPVPPYFLIRRSTASGTNPASHFDPWRSRASSPWMPSLPRPGAFTNPPPLRPRCNESCPRAPLLSRPLEVLPGAAAAAPCHAGAPPPTPSLAGGASLPPSSPSGLRLPQPADPTSARAAIPPTHPLAAPFYSAPSRRPLSRCQSPHFSGLCFVPGFLLCSGVTRGLAGFLDPAL